MKNLRKFLSKHPSLDSSSDEIEELPSILNLEAITKETKSISTVVLRNTTQTKDHCLNCLF